MNLAKLKGCERWRAWVTSRKLILSFEEWEWLTCTSQS